MVGSAAYGQSLRALDTCVIHVMARRVVGVSRSARLPVLLAAAGFLSAHNLFIQHCATTMDPSLRAEYSSVQSRLARLLGRIYGVASWEPKVEPLVLQEGMLPPRMYRVPLMTLTCRSSLQCCRTCRLCPPRIES